MKQSSFASPPPVSPAPRGSSWRPSSHRWSLSIAVALVGAAVLAPGSVFAKAKKPATKAESESAEARSKELMKKHFPLEEDIGPLPVVRVPKSEEGKVPAAKVEKPRPLKAKAEAKEVPHPVTGRPADSVMAAPSPPIDPVPVAPPKAKEPPEPERGAGPALGGEDNRQIDDLLSRALTDTHVAAAPQERVDPVLPPLGMVAIKQTMQALQPEVERDCRLGRLGVVLVRVVVAPTGEVARVTPQGKLAKASLAPCVAERVRRARFPRSAGGTFEYTLTVR
jgi:hypothetical protein